MQRMEAGPHRIGGHCSNQCSSCAPTPSDRSGQFSLEGGRAGGTRPSSPGFLCVGARTGFPHVRSGSSLQIDQEQCLHSTFITFFNHRAGRSSSLPLLRLLSYRNTLPINMRYHLKLRSRLFHSHFLPGLEPYEMRAWAFLNASCQPWRPEQHPSKHCSLPTHSWMAPTA